jgi:hypothetical protein
MWQRIALAAPLVATMSVCCACAALPGAGDIQGPLGPMPFPPRAPLPAALQAASAGLALVVILAVVHRLLRKRRKRIPPPVVASGLEGNLGNLDSADFYGVLLGAVRNALDGTVPSARSLTTREVAGAVLAVSVGTTDTERWRTLCAHAELSRYGGGSVDTHARRADLALAREAVEGLLAQEERHEP